MLAFHVGKIVKGIEDSLMLLIRVVSLIIACCLCEFAWSKPDFRDGFVVLNSNDTLRGLVEVDPGHGAFTSCHFRPVISEEIRIFTPGDVKGYGIYLGDVYASREIQRNGQVTERVFLRLIIRGPVSLYQLDDGFYVGKDDQAPFKLSNEEAEVFAGGQRTLKNTNKHIAILNMLMSDQPQLKSAILSIKLIEKSLIKLVEDYGSLKGTPVTNFNVNKPRIRPDGSNAITRETKDGFNHYESLWSKQTSIQNSHGVSIGSPSKMDGEISFLGGKVSSASNYPSYSLISPSLPMAAGYFSLGSSHLNRQFSDRHSTSDVFFSPYFNMGFTENHKTNVFSPTEPEGQRFQPAALTRDPFITGTNQYGYWGGIGVSKPFTGLSTYLELRYEQSGGTPLSAAGRFSPYQPSATNVQFVIGFRRR